MSPFPPAEAFSCLITADLHHDANPTANLGASVHVPADKANETPVIHQEVGEDLTSPEEHAVLLMFLPSLLAWDRSSFLPVYHHLSFNGVWDGFNDNRPISRCQSGRVLFGIKFILGLVGQIFQGRTSNF